MSETTDKNDILRSTADYLKNHPFKFLGLLASFGILSGGLIFFQYCIQNNLRFPIEMLSTPAALIWLSIGSIYVTLIFMVIVFMPMLMSKLAETLDVSQQTINSYEVARRRVPVSALPTLAILFEVSVDELLGKEDKQT